MKRVLTGLCMISLSLVISGCSLKNNLSFSFEKSNTKVEKRVPVSLQEEIIKKVKNTDKKIFSVSENLGLVRSEPLQSYFGASASISEDDYMLRKYAGESLLYSGFGVRRYIHFLIDTKNLNDAEKKAKKYGFKNIEDMYERLFNFVHSSSEEEIFFIIRNLENKKIIDTEYLYNYETLKEKERKIVSTVFAPYLKFEKMSEPKILPEWFFEINQKKINFHNSDYFSYAFVFVLMDQILSNRYKEGVLIDVF